MQPVRLYRLVAPFINGGGGGGGGGEEELNRKHDHLTHWAAECSL